MYIVNYSCMFQYYNLCPIQCHVFPLCYHSNLYCCRYPKDWNIPLGNTISIYGWGHNHRGQLGGIEGNKVKLPRLLENFSEISPVQICGGEQTLFAVTTDGKVMFGTLG